MSESQWFLCSVQTVAHQSSVRSQGRDHEKSQLSARFRIGFGCGFENDTSEKVVAGSASMNDRLIHVRNPDESQLNYRR